jgi:hypothetical protein
MKIILKKQYKTAVAILIVTLMIASGFGSIANAYQNPIKALVYVDDGAEERNDGTMESRASWSIETVDSSGVVGGYTSIVLDSNNRPHISYFDDTNGDLKYAKWTGSSWSIETVDSSGDVGYDTSIALDSNNRPHISYFDWINDDLKYAKWTGSSWSKETVDSSGDVGGYTSIVLDSNNRPHISYYDFTNGDLKYAKWTGSSWSIETVDSSGDAGGDTSIVLDSNNRPHISYFDYINYDLKYAKWTGSSWSKETVDSSGDVGRSTSIALDSNNRPHISYYDATNTNLKYAKWTGSSWSKETVDSSGDVGGDTSIVLDSNNRPHISYFDYTNKDLKYAKWTGSSWSIETVDSGGNVGYYPSIALDSNNRPHISYFDDTNDDLKYAKYTFQCSLTMNACTHGTTSPASPGTYTYAAGTSVTITAYPSTGYHFTSWSGTYSGSSNPYTFTINQNYVETANFEPDTVYYTLTMNACTHGTTNPASPGTYTYASGTSVTISATPASGYHFTGWSGTYAGSTNPYTFTINQNYDETANFKTGLLDQTFYTGDAIFFDKYAAGCIIPGQWWLPEWNGASQYPWDHGYYQIGEDYLNSAWCALYDEYNEDVDFVGDILPIGAPIDEHVIAWVGCEYEIPVINEKGTPHVAEISIEGEYGFTGHNNGWLQASIFNGGCYFDVGFNVWWIDSPYTEPNVFIKWEKEIKLIPLWFWNPLEINTDNWGKEITNINDQFSHQDTAWQLNLGEGYTYRFMLKIYAHIQTNSEDNPFVEDETFEGWARSDVSAIFSSIKLNWIDEGMTLNSNGNNPPYIPDEPEGSIGVIHQPHGFTSRTTDPDQDQIKYKWHWGDSETSEWSYLYQSGETVYDEHTYTKPGSYLVKIEAMDEHGALSGLSEEHYVIITVPQTSIEVESPGSGDQLRAEEEHEIKWFFNGDYGDEVVITLHKEAYPGIYQFITPEPIPANTHSYLWYIDENIDVGNNYRIGIWNEYNNTISEKFSIIEAEPKPDLECNGGLSWTSVTPGSTKTGSFTIENIGDSGSLLDWEITSYPGWGDWTFTPKSGEDLTPEEGLITIQVSVNAPNEKMKTFTGEIVITNKLDSNDKDTIPVSLATPRNKPITLPLFLQFLGRLIDKFPLLARILQLFPVFNKIYL